LVAVLLEQLLGQTAELAAELVHTAEAVAGVEVVEHIVAAVVAVEHIVAAVVAAGSAGQVLVLSFELVLVVPLVLVSELLISEPLLLLLLQLHVLWLNYQQQLCKQPFVVV